MRKLIFFKAKVLAGHVLMQVFSNRKRFSEQFKQLLLEGPEHSKHELWQCSQTPKLTFATVPEGQLDVQLPLCEKNPLPHAEQKSLSLKHSEHLLLHLAHSWNFSSLNISYCPLGQLLHLLSELIKKLSFGQPCTHFPW